jgi:hypothetical protein
METPPSNNIAIFKGFVGIIGNIFGLSFSIAPITLMKKLYDREQTYHQIPYLLMLMTILNSILWLSYGLIVDDIYMIFVNLMGALFNIIYLNIFFYYKFEDDRNKFYKVSCGFCFTLLFLFWELTYQIKNGDLSRYSAMIFNIFMYAAPGQKIVKLIFYFLLFFYFIFYIFYS